MDVRLALLFLARAASPSQSPSLWKQTRAAATRIRGGVAALEDFLLTHRAAARERGLAMPAQGGQEEELRWLARQHARWPPIAAGERVLVIGYCVSMVDGIGCTKPKCKACAGSRQEYFFEKAALSTATHSALPHRALSLSALC